MNPWIILGAAGVGLTLIIGAFFYGEHVDAQGYEKRLAVEQAASQKALSDYRAAQLVKEQAQEARNNEIEAQHAKDQATIDDAYVAYSNAIAQRVQPYRQCPSNSAGPAKAANSSGGSDDAVVGIFVPQSVVLALGTLARDADAWVAYGHACHTWAVSVGR